MKGEGAVYHDTKVGSIHNVTPHSYLSKIQRVFSQDNAASHTILLHRLEVLTHCVHTQYLPTLWCIAPYLSKAAFAKNFEELEIFYGIFSEPGNRSGWRGDTPSFCQGAGWTRIIIGIETQCWIRTQGCSSNSWITTTATATWRSWQKKKKTDYTILL